MEPQIPTNLQSEQSKTTLGQSFVEFIQTLVVFAAIGTAIYLFVAQPHKVSGSSMYPTFKDGDYIITDKVSYRFEEPQRGDVVVFKNPLDQSQDFIKRVIGLPGEKVKVQDGKVYLNDNPLVEPYLQPSIQTPSGAFMKEGDEVTIPNDHYLAFGDNRPFSSDSRSWGFVTKDEIIGKVFLRYWPESEIGLNPGAYTFSK